MRNFQLPKTFHCLPTLFKKYSNNFQGGYFRIDTYAKVVVISIYQKKKKNLIYGAWGYYFENQIANWSKFEFF
jgi:hypothetical protein